MRPFFSRFILIKTKGVLLIKTIKALASATILTLTGCATAMTPEQHTLFALDYALLHVCSEQGIINSNLAANGLALYRNRLNNYTADTKLIDEQAGMIYQAKDSIDSSTCNQYSVRLQSELMDQRVANQEMQNFNNAMAGFNNSMQQSTNESLERVNINNQNMRQRNESLYSDGFSGFEAFKGFGKP